MYESPIWIAVRDLHRSIMKEQDDYIFETVEKTLECKVDREELLKALAYDRNQYDKGFRDGRAYKSPIETNADRIRAMSDEELADWVWGAETDGRAYGPRGKKAWLDWLKQEVET